MRLSLWPSKSNQLLLGVLFYLLDCRQRFLVPVGVYSTKVLLSGFRRSGAVEFKVTEFSASVALRCCGRRTNIHGSPRPP